MTYTLREPGGADVFTTSQGITEASRASGQTFDAFGLNIAGIDGAGQDGTHAIAFIDDAEYTVVPEPASIVLLLMGIGLTLGCARGRQSHSS